MLSTTLIVLLLMLASLVLETVTLFTSDKYVSATSYILGGILAIVAIMILVGVINI